ncbi:hypothetical protein BJV78DRAFT_1355083 [Lactifluus subvellereus]|nr:hypothetical protein BJV78DRAFT_1355083 [Lactifluus subvellereus]
MVKLDHAIAGIYIWETVFTAGFELDVLRGKRPYRWTIWLYLGTRYCGLLLFILVLVGENSGKISCQPFVYANSALIAASWSFASLIIVLRVQVIPANLIILPSSCHPSSRIAIWNRQRLVTFLSVCVWLAGVATMLQGDAFPLLFHRLLMSFKCIIWIALASIAEVPVVVFVILNLNDAWNGMFVHSAGPSAQLACIVLYANTDPSPNICRPISNAQSRSRPGNVHNSIHFVAATQSNSTGSTSEAPVFIPKDPIQLSFDPGASNPRLVHEKPENKIGYDLETASFARMVISSLSHLFLDQTPETP